MANVVKLYYVDTGTTYKQWELLPNKLLVVDSIADYLATKTALTISNFQYVKNELEITINVDLSQSYSQPKTTTSFKYVSIQNNGEQLHYYFVKKIVWRSKSAVRLELVMDVLNTFKEGADYVFKENTRIIREHKDRFELYDTTLTFNIDSDWYYTAGSIAEGETITLLGEAGGNTFVICEGTFVSCIDYVLIIKPNEDVSIDHIKEELAKTYNQFLVQSDEYNYILFRFDSYSLTPKIMRKIDYVSEGITPILKHEGVYTISDTKSVLNKNWYLLYRNQNDPSDSLVNPVDCFLIPETAVQTDTGYIENGRLIPSWLEEGKYYTFYIESGKTCTLSNGASITYQSGQRRYVVFTKAGNKINALGLYVIEGGMDLELAIYWQYDDINYATFTGLPISYRVDSSMLAMRGTNFYYNSYTESFTNSESHAYVDPISYLDRTDAKNIKLIKLPYCPYDFSISGSTIQIDGSSVWELASFTQANGGVIHLLKLLNLNTSLTHDLTTTHTPFKNLYITSLNASINDLRKPISDEMESKLFHSDFYNPTFVYDSFAFKIDLEKSQNSYYQTNNKSSSMGIKFTMTKTINSKFMFTFGDYRSDKAESNFYRVLPIARNNEEVLYNVPYINYVRTGYQYDVKNKNISTISNAIGIGLSLASVGASLLFPSAPLKVAGVVASLVSVANSVKNTIVSEINNTNSIKQKQEQYKNQASSVVGSDDVDLMSSYCNNRLEYILYKPNDLMLNLLNDLFFYAGYNSNRMGLPNHNTRVNFDYLECEASIEKVDSIPDECLNELINCFKTGVCYLHKTTRTSDKWDFEQKYENWEQSMMEV